MATFQVRKAAIGLSVLSLFALGGCGVDRNNIVTRTHGELSTAARVPVENLVSALARGNEEETLDQLTDELKSSSKIRDQVRQLIKEVGLRHPLSGSVRKNRTEKLGVGIPDESVNCTKVAEDTHYCTVKLDKLDITGSWTEGYDALKNFLRNLSGPWKTRVTRDPNTGNYTGAVTALVPLNPEISPSNPASPNATHSAMAMPLPGSNTSTRSKALVSTSFI